MVTIESTPEMAANVYETMERNLTIIRRRLGKPLTLADKVLLGHLDDPENQEIEPGKSYLFLHPDRVILQDVLGQTAMSSSSNFAGESSGAHDYPLRPSYPGASRGRV